MYNAECTRARERDFGHPLFLAVKGKTPCLCFGPLRPASAGMKPRHSSGDHSSLFSQKVVCMILPRLWLTVHFFHNTLASLALSHTSTCCYSISLGMRRTTYIAGYENILMDCITPLRHPELKTADRIITVSENHQRTTWWGPSVREEEKHLCLQACQADEDIFKLNLLGEGNALIGLMPVPVIDAKSQERD